MFWFTTALMVALALAFVLPPLWRRNGSTDPDTEQRLHALEQAHASGVLSDDEYAAKRAQFAADETSPREARPWIAAATLALLIPLGAWLLYAQIGEPEGLDPAARSGSGMPAMVDADGRPMDMESAVAGLAERLRSEPDNLDGWLLLGRAYKTMERFEPAREAMAQAYRLAPDEPDVMIEYAETLALTSPQRRFAGQARELLDQAVAMRPDHQRGIWLLGVAAMQDGEYPQAIAHWQRLQTMLADDAEAHESLQLQIDAARARMGEAPAAAAAAPAQPQAAATRGPRLTVQVDIAPALRERLRASDVLFVFAQAPEGPRVPVAIQRLPAGSLPATVVLDDSTSMMPQLTLSSMAQVVVGARISRSGLAQPAPGDMEASTDPIATDRHEPVSLLIDRVIE